MVAQGFHDLRTVEVLLREFDIAAEAQVTSLEALVHGARERQGGGKRKRGSEGEGDAAGAAAEAPGKMTMARPRLEARGHTGYLTFARLGVKRPAGAEEAPEVEGEDE